MSALGETRRPTTIPELKAMILSKAVIIPKQMQRVARLGMERPDLIAFGSIQSIAAASGVSTATVNRLAHKLGFSNIREFKNLFRDHLRHTASAISLSSDISWRSASMGEALADFHRRREKVTARRRKRSYFAVDGM